MSELLVEPTAAGWSVQWSDPLGPNQSDRVPHAEAVGTYLDTVGSLGRRGRGEIHCWLPDDAAAANAITAALNAVRDRWLLLLAVALPLPHPWSVPGPPPAGVTVHAFRATDADAWVTTNRAAFAWHPEQATADHRTLEEATGQPWFDPDGFLLAWDDDRCLGFCWTRVHEELEPPEGEIYVIGVHPDEHGRGLGRWLVVAGLEHLAVDRGLSAAHLWVEADNEAALGLYHDLGFVVRRRRHALVVTAPAI